MPLVFVHGVATRSSDTQKAEVAQRDALFRRIVFQNADAGIWNPDWGSHAARFDPDLLWLPDAKQNEAFGAGATGAPTPEDMDHFLSLGKLAGSDAQQAIDLVVMAALDHAVTENSAIGVPEAAGAGEAIDFAVDASRYLDAKALSGAANPAGIAALAAGDNNAFIDALERELAAAPSEAYGAVGWIRDRVAHLGGMVGNGLSDAGLRWKRRAMSEGVARFLGDIFVYLRGRDDPGPAGTRARIFAPVIADIAKAAAAPRPASEPFIIVGHSLGGVILYDLLTDAAARAAIEDASGKPLAIDALVTVGSQPGFFADLGLYASRPEGGARLPMPADVARWLNVYDFTDIFSFRCAGAFEGVEDYAYDTVTDLVRAHSAYFLRASFYARMRARLFAA